MLVLHDLLGINAGPLPRFAKRFADVHSETVRGISDYAEAVRTRSFPDDEHSYGIAPEEIERLREQLPQRRR